jgi:hypothetical protein
MADSIQKKKFVPMVRQRAYEQRNGLFVPRNAGDIKTSWPVCMTCHHDVDSVNVEDISTNVVTIRATCHGKEATIKMEFPYRIIRREDKEVWMHVQSAINSSVFFDPSIA